MINNIGFVSTKKGEGTTTVIANIACIIGQSTKKVLIVDLTLSNYDKAIQTKKTKTINSFLVINIQKNVVLLSTHNKTKINFINFIKTFNSLHKYFDFALINIDSYEKQAELISICNEYFFITNPISFDIYDFIKVNNFIGKHKKNEAKLSTILLTKFNQEKTSNATTLITIKKNVPKNIIVLTLPFVTEIADNSKDIILDYSIKNPATEYSFKLGEITRMIVSKKISK